MDPNTWVVMIVLRKVDSSRARRHVGPRIRGRKMNGNAEHGRFPPGGMPLGGLVHHGRALPLMGNMSWLPVYPKDTDVITLPA